MVDDKRGQTHFFGKNGEQPVECLWVQVDGFGSKVYASMQVVICTNISPRYALIRPTFSTIDE
jgi:hypothetical protein